MANLRDRIILFPRYTTFAGDRDWTTLPINITAYEAGDVRIWIGDVAGVTTPGPISAAFEESTDLRRQDGRARESTEAAVAGSGRNPRGRDADGGARGPGTGPAGHRQPSARPRERIAAAGRAGLAARRHRTRERRVRG